VLTVAYLANEFPVSVEPYVGEEIQELRRRGVHIVASSVRKASAQPGRAPTAEDAGEVLCLQSFRPIIFVRAIGLAVRRWARISGFVARALLRGSEPVGRRLKALLHTCLGVYYAVLLQDQNVDHIHVHHGYFGSWIAMVAARLLGVGFSLTLHGSDLLLHSAYLDTKLKNCRCKRSACSMSSQASAHIQVRESRRDIVYQPPVVSGPRTVWGERLSEQRVSLVRRFSKAGCGVQGWDASPRLKFSRGIGHPVTTLGARSKRRDFAAYSECVGPELCLRRRREPVHGACEKNVPCFLRRRKQSSGPTHPYVTM